MDINHIVSRSSWKQWAAAVGVSSIMFHVSIFEIFLIKPGTESLTVVSEAIEQIGLLMIGAFLGAILADAFGRKITLFGAIFFVFPRMVAMIFEHEEWVWIIQIFIRLGMGMVSTLVPLYLTEIADIQNKGRLIAVQESIYLFATIIIALLMGALTNYSILDTMKILRGILFAVFVLFHFLIVAYFPESPHYLIAKKQYTEAVNSLVFLKGISRVNIQTKISELSQMRLQTNENRRALNKISEMFQLANRRTLAVIISLIAIKQASERNETETLIMFSLLDESWPGLNQLSLFAQGIRLILSVLVIWKMDIFKRKLSVLLVIIVISIATVIGMTGLAQITWVLFGVRIIRQFCHTIISCVAFGYMGDIFSTNARALTIATVVSCEVLIKGILVVWDHCLSMRSLETLSLYSHPTEYLRLCFIIDIIVYFYSFIFLLIFVPKTNKNCCPVI